MPEGFTGRAAWDAIHWEFSDRWSKRGAMSMLDWVVMTWQKENQERVMAAIDAKVKAKVNGTS